MKVMKAKVSERCKERTFFEVLNKQYLPRQHIKKNLFIIQITSNFVIFEENTKEQRGQF